MEIVKSNKICAGIVTFNPDLSRLNENIESIIGQIDHIVIVDNGSLNFDAIERLCFSKHIEVIHNTENLGIAEALYQIMDWSIVHRYEWTLTLDQDSVCFPSLIQLYEKYMSLPSVGMLTCLIQDRNFDEEKEKKTDYIEVNTCITSGSLMNMDAYQKTNGFDRQMFIDSVDFEMCIQLRKAGYKIYRVNETGLLHEVGHGKNVSLLGKKYITYNHSPFRQYYMARNHMYLARKYPDEKKLVKEILREIRSNLLILVYEEQKLQKIRARLKGFWDGLHMELHKDKRV